MGYEKIIHVKNNPTLENQYLLKQNVVYSREAGEEQKLTLILPWSVGVEGIEQKKRPLLVFVQGSAWTTPDFDYELPQLALYAREGFVVATVGHRDSSKGHPFPAYLQDVKCAIRYLRAHEEEYGIDPERVIIWGTSSGGNTALLVGVTGDEERYKTSEYTAYSDKVSAVVSCFGPTDMCELSAAIIHTPEGAAMAAALSGQDNPEGWQRVAKEMSPVYHVEEGKEYPKMLLLNGTADMVVPHTQMERMYDKLQACNADVQAYYVDDAEHEGNFWSEEVREIILKFMKKF